MGLDDRRTAGAGHMLRPVVARQDPGFTAAVVVTLALGIEAGTAILSFVDRLRRPLPFPHSERLCMLYRHWLGSHMPWTSLHTHLSIRRLRLVMSSEILAK